MTILTALGIASMLFTAWFTMRAYNAPETGTGQTRRASIIEAWVNILIGFSLNFVANFLLLPLLDSCTAPTAWQNFMLGWVYTAISMVRQYSIRRWFNDGIKVAAARLAALFSRRAKT